MAESIRWGAGREASFVEQIDFELKEALAARSGLEAQWRDWLSQYRPNPKPALKSFPYEGAFLARDTKVLTIGGWKRVDALRIGELVLTRKDDSGTLEWQPVEGSPQRFADKLYHFKSRSIDLLVTNDHAMICEHQDRPGVVVRMRAEELWGKTGYYLPMHGEWAGTHYDTLFGLDAGDVCEFVGWYLSEGWPSKGVSGFTAISISQSRSANASKVLRLEQLLQRLGFSWSRHRESLTVHKSTIPTRLFDMLCAERGATCKRVPAFFMALSAPLLDRLLSALIAGDGNVFWIKEYATYPKVSYYTTSQELANDVQVLVTLCGYHARIKSRVRVGAGGVVEEGRQIVAKHRCYEVTVCGSSRAKYDRSYREIVDYNDVAFCVTVKNHAIYARRGGVACWTGNSNYVLPMTATDADQLFAKFVQTIHAPDNLWTVSPLNERWKDASKPLQDFLQQLDYNLLRMYRVNKRAFLEMVKLGTAIYKTGWLYERRPVWTYDETGRRQHVQRIVSVPFVDHVKLADFVLPSYAYAVEPDDQGGAPWVAERLRIRTDRLRSIAGASEPYLPNINRSALDLIVNFVEGSRPEHDAKIEQLDFQKRLNTSGTSDGDDFDKDKADGSVTGGGVTTLPREIELWEISARSATGGRGARNESTAGSDNSEDDVKVWYHIPTRTLLRSVYAHYHHGHREYDVIRYFPGDGFYGIGLCEQKEMFQSLSSELMNFNIDNVLLANSRMIVARSGANIAPNEPIYPYKVWLTDGDVRQDFGIFPMADIYQSLPLLQSQVQALGERRTGISDIQLGNLQQLPGRTPATTMLSLLQEGNRRPDLTIKDMRYEGLSVVGLRLLQLCQQHISSPVDLGGQRWLQMAVDMLGMPEGAIVAEKLSMPLEPAEFGVGVSLTATSGSANKEVERQGALALLQLAAQVAPQFIQLVQVAVQTAGTPISDVALQSAKGLQELYKRVLEQHDVRNIEDILPLADQLASASPGNFGASPSGPFGNGGSGAGDAGLDPAMATLLASLGGAGGGPAT